MRHKLKNLILKNVLKIWSIIDIIISKAVSINSKTISFIERKNYHLYKLNYLIFSSSFSINQLIGIRSCSKRNPLNSLNRNAS